MYLFGLLCLVASTAALPALLSDSSKIESQHPKFDFNGPQNIANIEDGKEKKEDYKDIKGDENKSEFQNSPNSSEDKSKSKVEKYDKVDETEQIPDIDIFDFVSFLTSVQLPSYINWPFFFSPDFDIHELISL